MQEFDSWIHSKEGIKEALRRNKMTKDRVIGLPPKKAAARDDYSEFLEQYVFNQLGMTPHELYRSLETMYYSEQDWRDRRQTNIDFTRGRHFGRRVYDAEAKRWMSQLEYLQRRNIPPLTYNVISKLVRSLVGQFRDVNTGNIVKCESKNQRGQELANYLTEVLNRAKSKNNAKQKDARNMKEMLQSGRPIYKVLWGSKDNMSKKDIRFRVVTAAKFGVNPGIVDDDKANLHLAYELHDTDLNSIVELFAKGDYQRGKEIKEAYYKYYGNVIKTSQYTSQSFDGSELRNLTFHTQGFGNSSYRYVEIWNKISDFEAATFDPLEVPGNKHKVYKWQNPEDVKKKIDAINQERMANAEGDIDPKEYLVQMNVDYRSRWYVSFITPWGYLLDVRESPYKNGMLPYIFPAPDINGEMWGLVEEVLNAQLSLDRQILLADNIIDNASKGVWLIPDNAVPEDMTRGEYKTELKKADGAVYVKTEDGKSLENSLPRQVYAQAANVSNNVQQLIQMYSGLVDEISGNYGAAQGKETGGAGKTATGYALESQNAGLNVRDTFETFLDVLLQRDELMLSFILEGYTKSDYFDVLGVELDPKEFLKFEFSIEQSKGTNSPAHRLALEQELLQLVYNELLPFEVFLDISNNPVMIQAKQKLQEHQKNQAIAMQQAQAQNQGGGGGGTAGELPPGTNGFASVQGHPQAGTLQQQPVEQELGKLPLIPQQNIV